MGLGDFFLGARPDMRWLPGAQDYFNQTFNSRATKSRGEKWDNSILGAGMRGDYSGMPGIGMFDQQLSNANQVTDRRIEGDVGLRDQMGLKERLAQLGEQRNQQTIGGQRMQYVGDQLNQAALGSEAGKGRREQYQQNAQLGSLGMLSSLMYNRNQRSGGVLNPLLQGAGAVGAAYAGHA